LFCGLIKGISLKMYILCVRVKIKKHLFESFCVWIFKKTTGKKIIWTYILAILDGPAPCCSHQELYTCLLKHINYYKHQLHLPLFSLAMSLISIGRCVSCNYGSGTGSQILTVHSHAQQCKWEFPRHQLKLKWSNPKGFRNTNSHLYPHPQKSARKGSNRRKTN